MLRGWALRPLVSIRGLPRCAHRYSTRTPWRQDTTPDPSVFVEENFAKHTLFVLDVAKRFFKFSAIGLFALGTTAATVYEGAHLWVENVELAPEMDAEIRKWEWDQESEHWSGDFTRGGTDPALGFKARHSVRAAWMAYNWGVGYSTSVIGSETAKGGLPGPGGLNVIDASLQRTEDFLNTAISIAENNAVDGKLHPRTITELVVRRATILERLGVQYLGESKDLYTRAWVGFGGSDYTSAKVAAKLGDISSRLGQQDDAIIWWSRAVQILRGPAFDTLETLPKAIDSAPTSPAAQRLLSNILVSLSAFYAKAGRLNHAQSIEEVSLNMFRSIPVPESVASASPPQALHALYILQRSALLSMHLAEVLHAQRKQPALSLQWLNSAAQSSERVANALSVSPDESGSSTETIPRLMTRSPLPDYTSSRTMTKVSTGLLRDARRTAAEAWNLMGILNEIQGKDLMIALRCYERAIDWAGTPPDTEGIRRPTEETLNSDWNVFLGNYTRAKQLVDQSKS